VHQLPSKVVRLERSVPAEIARFGPSFELRAGRVHFTQKFFAPGDVGGQGLGVGILAVAGLGLGEPCVHVEAQLTVNVDEAGGHARF